MELETGRILQASACPGNWKRGGKVGGHVEEGRGTGGAGGEEEGPRAAEVNHGDDARRRRAEAGLVLGVDAKRGRRRRIRLMVREEPEELGPGRARGGGGKRLHPAQRAGRLGIRLVLE